MRKDIKNLYLIELLGYDKIWDRALEYPSRSPLEGVLYDALCCKKDLVKFIYEITGLEKDYGFFKYGK